MSSNYLLMIRERCGEIQGSRIVNNSIGILFGPVDFPFTRDLMMLDTSSEVEGEMKVSGLGDLL